MNNLKKKKKRYMFIASVDDKKNPVSNEIVIAGLARLIKTIGLATWLESPLEPIRRFISKAGGDDVPENYMELVFTCSIRKEQLSSIRNAFFEYFPDGSIRCLEMTKH